MSTRRIGRVRDNTLHQGYVSPAVAQVDRETLGQWGVVFEQENLAAGGKRRFVGHRDR